MKNLKSIKMIRLLGLVVLSINASQPGLPVPNQQKSAYEIYESFMKALHVMNPKLPDKPNLQIERGVLEFYDVLFKIKDELSGNQNLTNRFLAFLDETIRKEEAALRSNEPRRNNNIVTVLDYTQLKFVSLLKEFRAALLNQNSELTIYRDNDIALVKAYKQRAEQYSLDIQAAQEKRLAELIKLAQEYEEKRHNQPVCCNQKADGQPCSEADECRGSCKCGLAGIGKKCLINGVCQNQSKYCDVSKCVE